MMWNLMKAEWIKVRRCQIFLVGIVALTLCPVIQYGSPLVMAPEYREFDYNFTHLFANVIWGNTQIFLPISLVMTGGWFLDREWTHDTLKNVVTVPVTMPKLLGAKLLITGLLALAFFLGYSILFFKSGVLLSAYPFSAALILVGFDMTQYNGANSAPDYLLAIAGMGAVLLATAFLLAASGRRKEIKSGQKQKTKGRRKGMRT